VREPFLDTNVVAYALANDARKKGIAEELLLDRPWVSVQVINEREPFHRVIL
jgi:predicted nucleic acid-binding protein